MRTIDIPTGHIIIDEYSKGELETLSIADYGKHRNIKAPFLGFNNDINGVDNGDTLPLSIKWVVTLSTQYGCPMKCTFCDVPNLGYHGNASVHDLWGQLLNALSLHPEVQYTDRLNIHFARMGEPTFNPAVLEFATELATHKRRVQAASGVRVETIHPVVSTMVPKGRKHEALDYIRNWIDIKNNLYNGQAGLQISVNSTNEAQRTEMFQGLQTSLTDISSYLADVDDPLGRKYTLNFALAEGYEIDGEKLARLFDPYKWMVKITPIHQTQSSQKNGLETIGGYENFTPYKEAEESCRDAGFDTIVFVPSMDEEDGCVTCGNAILGGSVLAV